MPVSKNTFKNSCPLRQTEIFKLYFPKFWIFGIHLNYKYAFVPLVTVKHARIHNEVNLMRYSNKRITL